MITIPSLSVETLKDQFPSVFASEPDNFVSDHYSFVSTEKAIDNLCEVGFVVSDVVGGKNPRGRHMVRMRHIDHLDKEEGFIPELVIQNSHNWECSFQLLFGVFRMICSNGMFVSVGDAEHYRSRHVGIEDPYEVVREFSINANLVKAKIEEYLGMELKTVEALEMAKKLASLRWDKSIAEDMAPLLVQPRREEDKPQDLWTVSNVIQENMMRGGFRNPVSNRMVKPINNAQQTSLINEGIANISERYLSMVA